MANVGEPVREIEVIPRRRMPPPEPATPRREREAPSPREPGRRKREEQAEMLQRSLHQAQRAYRLNKNEVPSP